MKIYFLLSFILFHIYTFKHYNKSNKSPYVFTIIKRIAIAMYECITRNTTISESFLMKEEEAGLKSSKPFSSTRILLKPFLFLVHETRIVFFLPGMHPTARFLRKGRPQDYFFSDRGTKAKGWNRRGGLLRGYAADNIYACTRRPWSASVYGITIAGNRWRTVSCSLAITSQAAAKILRFHGTTRIADIS